MFMMFNTLTFSAIILFQIYMNIFLILGSFSFSCLLDLNLNLCATFICNLFLCACTRKIERQSKERKKGRKDTHKERERERER